MLEEGNSYLVHETKNGLKIFERLVLDHTPGLFITRTHPDKLKSKLGLKQARIFWLSTDKEDPNSTHSANVGIVGQIIDSFLRQEKHAKVVLLDGLEYLVTNNGFGAVLRWLSDIVDAAASTGSILLVTVSQRAYTEKELALLKRNLEEVPKARTAR